MIRNLVFLVVAVLCHCIIAKRYKAHDKVDLVANTVGPFNNPTETYPYYSLPFCEHTGKQKRHRQNLGETLAGSMKVKSPYEITFLDPVPWRLLCEDFLGAEDIKELKEAVEDDYFFEMFLDDLPMWAYVGEVVHEEFLLGKSIQGARVYLYPHLSFSIGFNDDQIVSVNVTTDPHRRVDVTETTQGQEIIFSYSVDWVHQPHIAYANRMHIYEEHSPFLPETFEIHWLSIINSVVLVFLLMAFQAMVLLRILKNDFSKFVNVDEEDLTEEETGWKMIHGDVFRVPNLANLFTAMVGAGAQIFATAFIVLVLVLVGAFKATKRGALLTAGIIVFSCCGIFGGMVAGRLYKQLKGKDWAWNVILTSCIVPVPMACVFTFVNSVALSNNSTAALPAMVIAIISLIIVFVHFPLTVGGAILARNLTEDYRPPCRTSKVPREVPVLGEWYKHPLVQVFMAGFLPFSAIYIELHYIFASMWGHKIYTLFGILFLAFVMLSLVTSLITISLLYFQLCREDHRWWWQSFINGGATGLFIFAYSFYYLFNRSNMDGFLQLSFYFGYTGMVSYFFFLMLGFVGFVSSFTFVEYIFKAVKTD